MSGDLDSVEGDSALGASTLIFLRSEPEEQSMPVISPSLNAAQTPRSLSVPQSELQKPNKPATAPARDIQNVPEFPAIPRATELSGLPMVVQAPKFLGLRPTALLPPECPVHPRALRTPKFHFSDC